MPTYEFHCKACDRHFEDEESVAAHAEHLVRHDLKCPKCKSDDVEPQIAPFEVETPRKS